MLSSLEVVLSVVFIVLSKELKDELDVTPTLQEGMTNAVNRAKALMTFLFFITP